MKKRWKKKWFGMITAAILIAFTGYALMDTFVIERSYEQVQSAATGTESDASATRITVGDGTETDEEELRSPCRTMSRRRTVMKMKT